MGKVNAIYQDEIEQAFEAGAKDAYYGYDRDSNKFSGDALKSYWEGYREAPYGEKDWGYDD